MATLPPIQVHYEVIRNDPGFPLKFLPDDVQTMILHDPYNRTGRNPMPASVMSQYGTTYNMMRSAIAYKRCGQQVVVLGPRMQEAFANTSLKEVNPDFVRLPHKCFYLATPGCKLKVWGGEYTQWHTIAGAYVMEDPMEPGLLSFLVWGAANEKSVSPTDDATFWFCLRVNTKTMGTSADIDQEFNLSINEKELKDGTLHNVELEARSVRAARANDLDGFIEAVLGSETNDVSDLGMKVTWNHSDEVVKEVKANVQAFLRIAINTVLYMNSTGCEAIHDTGEDREQKRRELQASLGRKKHKNGKDAKKITRDLDKLPVYKVTWIGPTIEQSHGGDTDLTCNRTVRGHVRRGHWHTFRVGPRKDAHTGERIPAQAQKASLKWLPPTWVAGGQDTDQPRVYAVKEPVAP